MRMRSNSLLLMLGKSDLTVFVFSCRVFMWEILADLRWVCEGVLVVPFGSVLTFDS